MRNRETYFEQVPIAIVETVLRQAAALAEELEKTPASSRKRLRQFRRQGAKTWRNY